MSVTQVSPTAFRTAPGPPYVPMMGVPPMGMPPQPQLQPQLLPQPQLVPVGLAPAPSSAYYYAQAAGAPPLPHSHSGGAGWVPGSQGAGVAPGVLVPQSRSQGNIQSPLGGSTGGVPGGRGTVGLPPVAAQYAAPSPGGGILQAGQQFVPPTSSPTSSAVASAFPACDGVRNAASRNPVNSESDGLTDEMREICHKIDADKNGTISELEFVAAVQKHPEVAAFVLPGLDSEKTRVDENCFDAVDGMFDKIAGGKQRIKYADFAAHFRRAASRKVTSDTEQVRKIYSRIDADGNGWVSKLELVEAVQRNPEVAHFVLPNAGGNHDVMNDEGAFDAVKRLFEAIARGKKRFDLADFEAHFRQEISDLDQQPGLRGGQDRAGHRVFIIGPGFGRALNPAQAAMLEQAGYQIYWCQDGLPNPEQPNFPVGPYLNKIKAEIDAFQPDVLACASKGGAYLVGLWNTGLWRGPSLLLNAHPSCTQLPEGVSVVLAQGSNDEVYPTARGRLEELLATGTPNRCLLYFTADSGLLSSGQKSRVGDRHNMQSLLKHDCLPRLIDAALCSDGGPEVSLVRSWRDRLSEERTEAERWLGYSPERLRRRWCSPNCKGMDEQKLFDVPFGSEEFQYVSTVFKAMPTEPSVYLLQPPAAWERVQLKSVQRIENGFQEEGCSGAYYESLRKSIEEQGLEFEPGVHTSWAFHGADNEALESIINNPVAGFQPLASGTRGASLWGSGTYFARDAKYVAEGGFCRPAADGTRRALMCLLMSGMPCLGDPNHKGVLPFRQKPHRYHCTVDSLASPEIYVIQHAGAAHAAYLVTFA